GDFALSRTAARGNNPAQGRRGRAVLLPGCIATNIFMAMTWGRLRIMQPSQPPLEDPPDPQLDAARVTCSGTDEDRLVQPVVPPLGGDELGHRAEVIFARIDLLAPPQAVHHVRRAMAQSLVADLDQGAVVGLDRID